MSNGEHAFREVRQNVQIPASQVLAGRRLSLPFQFIGPAVFVADVGIIAGAAGCVAAAGHRVVLGNLADLHPTLGIGALALGPCSLLALCHHYCPKTLMHLRLQIQQVTLLWFLMLLVLVSMASSFGMMETFSLNATLTFFAVGWLSLVGWRCCVANHLNSLSSKSGFARRHVIIIGEQAQLTSSAVARALGRSGYVPYHTCVIAENDIEANGTTGTLRDSIRTVIDITRREPIERIFLLIDWSRERCIENIKDLLKALPISVHLLPDRNASKFLGETENFWSAELLPAPLTQWECFLKRSADIALAGAALLLLSPSMIFIAILIKLDSQGPVLFRQTRNGFNGKPFSILKFRSMRVLENGPVVRQATFNDPRITSVGRLLRRTNLDELPQLFNVLRGEMSLIGPRPHAVAHNREYGQRIAAYSVRHHVKPGLTGWAQVNGYRGETSTLELMEKRVECDLWYIKNWSIWLDARILLRTLLMGLQESAY